MTENNFSKNIFIILFFVVVSFVIFVFSVIPEKTKVLTVAFLDVGQGDAIYVEAPTGEQILIDGGKDRTVLNRLSEVMPWLDRSIDIVLATHPDQDHIGGLIPVFDSYEIGQVVTTGSTAETDIFQSLYQRTLSEGSEVSLVRRGSTIDLGDVQIDILFPEQVFEISDRNVNSIVLTLKYGDIQFLLTGDVGVEQERHLINEYGSELKSDVLKLGHHGSKTSSDQHFLEIVSPEVAIVSAAKNSKYGHPAPEVIDRLKSLGMPVVSTAHEGNIVFETDGYYLKKQ